MHRRLWFWISLVAGTALCQVTLADLFGSGANEFEIEFVTIGNPGNAPDPLLPTGFPPNVGAVDYTYRIGTYEVRRDAIEKADAEGGLNINLDDGLSPEHPVTLTISWNAAARFVNWLNTSQGYPPAYKFELQPGQGGYNPHDDIELWQPFEEGFDPTNAYRNRLAKYFLPTEHEWYKAAYYDPAESVYYEYPTGSNSIPDGIDFSGDTVFAAVYADPFNLGTPNEVTNVGAASPYGTFGQGGNVWEMIESAFVPPNDDVEKQRTIRGGAWNIDVNRLRASALWGRVDWFRLSGSNNVGFRVASAVVSTLPGDYNGDGVVNAGDYVVYRNRLAGIGGTTLMNEGVTPGVVTIEDYEFWKAHYGDTLGSGSWLADGTTNVPEPNALLLLLTAIGVTCLARSLSATRRAGRIADRLL